MENVMTKTNGFAELSANEMTEVNGGFSVTIDFGIFKLTVDSNDVKAAYDWYKNTAYPNLSNFGGKVYDWTH